MFGNNAWDGYTAKSYEYKPTWEKDVDYNPDRRPSSSAEYFVTPDDGSVLCLLQVRGLGVLTFRAVSDLDDPRGRLRFTGVGLYSKSDIGYSPNI